MHFSRLGPPHGTCSEKNPFEDDGFKYTLLSCQKMCAQKAVAHNCQCVDITLPGRKLYPNIPTCGNYDNIALRCKDNATSEECIEAENYFADGIACARLVSRDEMKNTSCHCPSPCREVKYDVSYSLAKWPTDAMDGDSVVKHFLQSFHENYIHNIPDSKKREVYESYFNLSNRHEAKKQFTKLKVYLLDSNVIKTEETPDYPVNDLLSDIGGQMELWMGISLLSLVEVMQYAAVILRYITCCGKKKSKNKTPTSKPKSIICCGGRENSENKTSTPEPKFPICCGLTAELHCINLENTTSTPEHKFLICCCRTKNTEK
jgi:hypothetical protein